ncbi:MAG: hypothetical protein PVF43_08610 [Candidatus Eiseniibacteriota bacterium]|jgi:hypothetical protein
MLAKMWMLMLALIVAAYASPLQAGAPDASWQPSGRTPADPGSAGQASLGEEPGELRSWHLSRALYVRGGMAQWTATFGDNFGTGFGLQGGFAYGLRPSLVMRVTGGFYTWNADDLATGDPQRDELLNGRDASASVMTMPITVGADYLLPRQSFGIPYLGGGAGVTFVRGNFDDVDASFFKFDDLLEGYFAVQIRGGLTIQRRDSNLAFELGGSWNMIMDGLAEFSFGDPSHHDYYELGAGIVYFLSEY